MGGKCCLRTCFPLFYDQAMAGDKINYIFSKLWTDRWYYSHILFVSLFCRNVRNEMTQVGLSNHAGERRGIDEILRCAAFAKALKLISYISLHGKPGHQALASDAIDALANELAERLDIVCEVIIVE